jgi:hypothetical protein
MPLSSGSQNCFQRLLRTNLVPLKIGTVRSSKKSKHWVTRMCTTALKICKLIQNSLLNDQRDVQFFYMYLFIFLTLYTFRAHRAHHQERQIVSIQPLVAVTLCHWPWRVQVGSEHFRPAHDTATDSYQRLYWHSFSLLMISTMCSKRVES